jgi:hypothetical protein
MGEKNRGEKSGDKGGLFFNLLCSLDIKWNNVRHLCEGVNLC